MTDTSLNDALKEAYTHAEPQDVIIDTLEFQTLSPQNPQQPTSIAKIVKGTALSHIASENHSLNSSLAIWNAPIEDNSIQSFTPLNFDISLAPVSSEPTPEMSITIDNIGLIFFHALDDAINSRKRVIIIYRPYISSRIQDGPQMTPPPSLTITDSSANNYHISLKARMLDIADRSFPANLYTPSQYPGLFAL